MFYVCTFLQSFSVISAIFALFVLQFMLDISLPYKASDSKRNLQLLESKIISEGWECVPINGIYGSSDRTMLHLAVQADVNGNFIDTIEFLIKNGINVNARDSRGSTVLHYLSAGTNGCTDAEYKIAKLILDNGGDAGIFNHNNMPALRSAIKHTKDDYRLMRLFFQYNISEDALNDLEQTAKVIGNREVLELIEHKRLCTKNRIIKRKQNGC